MIANADPGDDGMYRSRQEDAVIRRYLRAARRAKALLLLDIQPGRSDFFTETTRLEKWLKEPDVGLALDPEWRVSEGEVPGQVIGHVDVARGQRHSAWLAKLVAEQRPAREAVRHPPVHRRHGRRHRDLKQRDGLDMVLNVDGFGGQEVKVAKYHDFTREAQGLPPRLQAVLRGGQRTS